MQGTICVVASSHHLALSPFPPLSLSQPGVFFNFELSPMRMRMEERRNSFLHFLTRVCAILGGVFTIMGAVDKLVTSGLEGLTRVRGAGRRAALLLGAVGVSALALAARVLLRRLSGRSRRAGAGWERLLQGSFLAEKHLRRVTMI